MIHYTKNPPYIERLKANLMIGIFVISLILSTIESTNLKQRSDFNNFFKVMFVIVYFNDTLRSMYRIAYMCYDTYKFVGVFMSFLLVFSIFSRILFDGQEIGSDEDAITFMYSFTDIFRSFETMFITVLMENFPDIIIDAYHINSLYALYFIFFIFITSIIIFAMLVGMFGDSYCSFYT